MIRAEFYRRHGKLTGFLISGHALFDEYGRDIVCASVTSAVQLTANGITECAGGTADVSVRENSIGLTLKKCDDISVCFLQALRLHLECLSQDYEKTIELIDLEV
ncbi:MAG TPA: ribosomal-processing cysteine protease Prp [Firmicutes bacterium]|nr:ribosomal-processing cysteine protease Prp [Bacillota bacterium]